MELSRSCLKYNKLCDTRESLGALVALSLGHMAGVGDDSSCQHVSEGHHVTKMM